MVPSAGLEPAWVTPYAPQTYVSTNSTTTARGPISKASPDCPRKAARRSERAVRLPARRRRRGRRRSRRRRLLLRGRGRKRLVDHGRLRARLDDREQHRDQHEADEGEGRELVKKRRRSPGAEGGLARPAAERAGDVRSLALLEENHQDQEEADDDVDGDQGDIQHGGLHEKGRKCTRPARGRQARAMASKEAADRLAPPIRNPFTPGAAASSAAFSGRTEPP